MSDWLEPKWWTFPTYLFALWMCAVGCWGFSNKWLDPAIQLHLPNLANGMHLSFEFVAASLGAIAAKLTVLATFVIFDDWRRDP